MHIHGHVVSVLITLPLHRYYQHTLVPGIVEGQFQDLQLTASEESFALQMEGDSISEFALDTCFKILYSIK